MEPSVEISNAELTLSLIRADIVAAAANLTEIYTDYEIAKEALAATRNEHQAELSTMEAERADLAQKHLAFDQRSKEMEGKEALHKSEVEILVQQKRDALRELNRANEWIATADLTLAAKNVEIAELDERLALRGQLEAEIAVLSVQVAAEEAKRDAARIETSLLVDNAQAEAARLASEAEAARAVKDAAELRLSEANGERESAVSDKERIRADCEIYIRRIEEKYQEAFPDLRMIF